MRLYLSADTKEKLGYTPDWIRITYTKNGMNYELTLDIAAETIYTPDAFDCRSKGDLIPLKFYNVTTGEEIDLDTIGYEEGIFSNRELINIFRYGRDITVNLDIVRDEEWYELAMKDEFRNCRGKVCIFDGVEEHKIDFAFTPMLGDEPILVKDADLTEER